MKPMYLLVSREGLTIESLDLKILIGLYRGMTFGFKNQFLGVVTLDQNRQTTKLNKMPFLMLYIEENYQN